MKLTEERKQKILEMIEKIPQEKLHKLEEYIKQAQDKQCDIHDVSNRRELLISFEANRHGSNWDGEYKEKRISDIDEFLKSN